MPLNAPIEWGAVTHWGIVPQGPSELCKFTKVLCFELKSMCMAKEELEITNISLGNFKLERILHLLLMVIVDFIICWLGLCREMRCAFSLSVKQGISLLSNSLGFILFSLMSSRAVLSICLESDMILS